MLQVRQIVNQIFTSNTYVVLDDDYDYCWLIDIGDYDKVVEAIPQDMEIRGVFLTHTHFDHIYGINALYKAYPGCRIYTSEYGKEALFDEKKNFSKYHQAPLVYEGAEIVVLNDNDYLDIYPDVLLTVYVTPGHCLSCLTYALSDWVFTGDSFIPGIKVVTKLPKGDRHAAKESIERIMLLSKNRIVCPGHGAMSRSW